MNKPTILFLDDEERIVRTLGVLFKTQGKYDVLTSVSAKEALQYFDEHEIHVVVSDQRMPEMSGVDFLSKVQEKSPNTIRILLTGYADLDAIVGSINEGEVYRYITKPWQNDMLKDTVAKASEAARLLFSTPEEPKQEGEHPSGAKDSGILVLHSEEDDITSLIKDIYKENPIYDVTDAQQVTSILSENDISVVVADISQNRDDLASIVKLIKHANPSAMSIVLTDSADANTAISLINQGQIYRYLPKPVKSGRLKMSIASALEYAGKCKSSPDHVKRHAVEEVTYNQGGEISASIRSLFSKMRRSVLG